MLAATSAESRRGCLVDGESAESAIACGITPTSQRDVGETSLTKVLTLSVGIWSEFKGCSYETAVRGRGEARTTASLSVGST